MAQKPNIEIILHCTLNCGREVARAMVFEDEDENEYRAREHIIDQRCGSCEEIHGTYRDLADSFRQETGEKDEKKVEKFVIENPKRLEFRSALDAEVAKRKKQKERL